MFYYKIAKGAKEELDQIKKIIQEVMKKTYEALEQFLKPDKDDEEEIEEEE